MVSNVMIRFSKTALWTSRTAIISRSAAFVGRMPLTPIMSSQRRYIGSVSAFDSVIFRNLFGTEEIRSVSSQFLWLYSPSQFHTCTEVD